MIFQVTMKDPDTLSDACKAAALQSVATLGELSQDERDSIVETRAEGYRNLAAKWFRYGEYLTVEIDTQLGTCVVVEAK